MKLTLQRGTLELTFPLEIFASPAGVVEVYLSELGSVVLSPDDADKLADYLKIQADLVRRKYRVA